MVPALWIWASTAIIYIAFRPLPECCSRHWIQKKLAARHLQDDSLVLYDLSPGYFEGTHCPLAKLGYSRDGKGGTLQVNYGLLTDGRGCPVVIIVTHEMAFARSFAKRVLFMAEG